LLHVAQYRIETQGNKETRKRGNKRQDKVESPFVFVSEFFDFGKIDEEQADEDKDSRDQNVFHVHGRNGWFSVSKYFFSQLEAGHCKRYARFYFRFQIFVLSL